MVVFYNLCISVGSVVMSSLSFPILFIGVKFGSSFVCFVYLFEISVSFIFSIVYLVVFIFFFLLIWTSFICNWLWNWLILLNIMVLKFIQVLNISIPYFPLICSFVFWGFMKSQKSYPWSTTVKNIKWKIPEINNL